MEQKRVENDVLTIKVYLIKWMHTTKPSDSQPHWYWSTDLSRSDFLATDLMFTQAKALTVTAVYFPPSDNANEGLAAAELISILSIYTLKLLYYYVQL